MISLLPTNGMPACVLTVTLTPAVSVHRGCSVMIFCPVIVVLCCTFVALVWETRSSSTGVAPVILACATS